MACPGRRRLEHSVRPLVYAVLACSVAASLCACDSTETRRLEVRRVIPAADPVCGAPADARTLLITALGPFPPAESTADSRTVADGVAFEISSFPPDTRVLSLQVIGTGGAVRTIGQTEPFELEAVDDGAVLPVFMAPPRGFCATGPPAVARIGPLVAAIGSRVVVAGGMDDTGAPVSTIELYDPSTGAFSAVAVDVYADDALGLLGASMTSLGDGRVIIAGGSQTAFQVFDGATDSVGAARFLPQARAHHAAVALGGGRVLLVGGCARLESDGTCDGTSTLATTTLVDVEREVVTDGPFLGRPRRGGHAVREADGRVLVAGGVDEAGDVITVAERIDPEGTLAREDVPDAHGLVAPLDAGGAFVGFGTATAPATASAAVVPPGATAASAVTPATAARSGGTVTPLSDGRLLVLGGLEADAGSEALYYVPSTGGFEALATAPARNGDVQRRRDHAAIRLADGTVLVVGGRDATGAALTDAWIYRPDLLGPFATNVTVSFGDASLAQHIVPRDPARVRVDVASGPPSRLVMTSSMTGQLPSEWAVVAGPTFASATAVVRARSPNGGLAILFWFDDPGHYAAAVVVPGQSAKLYRVVDGVVGQAGDCESEAVDAAALRDGFVDVEVEARATTLRMDLGGRTVLTCSGLDETGPGRVGVGVVGDPGNTLEVSSITVRR